MRCRCRVLHAAAGGAFGCSRAQLQARVLLRCHCGPRRGTISAPGVGPYPPSIKVKRFPAESRPFPPGGKFSTPCSPSSCQHRQYQSVSPVQSKMVLIPNESKMPPHQQQHQPQPQQPMGFPPLYQYTMPPLSTAYPYQVYAYPYAEHAVQHPAQHTMHHPYHIASSSSPSSSSSVASPLSTAEHRKSSLDSLNSQAQVQVQIQRPLPGPKISSTLALQSLPPDTMQVPLSTPTKQVYFHPQYPGVVYSSSTTSESGNISTIANTSAATSTGTSASSSTESCNTTINSDAGSSTPGFYVPPSLSPLQLPTKQHQKQQQLAPPHAHFSQISHYPLIQQQQQQQQFSSTPSESPEGCGSGAPPPIDISVLTPIPGCMAYRHPLIPVIPSASGNTRKQTRRLFDVTTNSFSDGPVEGETSADTPGALGGAPQTRRMAFGSPTWTQKDDELLRHLKETEKIGWRDISMYFPTRTINACQFRWRRLVMKEENRRKRELHKSALRARLVK